MEERIFVWSEELMWKCGGMLLQLHTLENRGGLPTPLSQIPQLAGYVGIDEHLRQVLLQTRSLSSARANEIATEAQRMLMRIESATSRRVYRGNRTSRRESRV